MSRKTITFASLALISGAVIPAAGVAQPATGNRANGFNYQPTPGEVLPLEKREGAAASPGQAVSNGRTLESIDRELLRNNGMSTESLPNFGDREEQTAPKLPAH